TSLKRKYGDTIEGILEYKEKLELEIEQIENSEQINKKLRIELKQTEDKMNLLSERMNEIRNRYGIILSNKINEELKDLNMPNAKFNIKVEKQEIYNLNGYDKVEFVICTNVGEEYKELIKIA